MKFISWPLGHSWGSHWLYNFTADNQLLKGSSVILLASHTVLPLSYTAKPYRWCYLVAYSDKDSEICYLPFFLWLAVCVFCCMQDLNEFKANQHLLLSPSQASHMLPLLVDCNGINIIFLSNILHGKALRKTVCLFWYIR